MRNQAGAANQQTNMLFTVAQPSGTQQWHPTGTMNNQGIPVGQTVNSLNEAEKDKGHCVAWCTGQCHLSTLLLAS